MKVFSKRAEQIQNFILRHIQLLEASLYKPFCLSLIIDYLVLFNFKNIYPVMTATIVGSKYLPISNISTCYFFKWTENINFLLHLSI